MERKQMKESNVNVKMFVQNEIVHKQLISETKQIKKSNVKNKTYLEINYNKNQTKISYQYFSRNENISKCETRYFFKKE